MREHYKVVDKDALVVPLRPNWSQRQFLKVMRQQQEARKPVRIIIVKGRQVGITTLVVALICIRTRFRNNRSAWIIGHLDETTAIAFQKIKFAEERLAEEEPSLAFHMSKCNESEIEYGLYKSAIRMVTSGSLAAGRSFTAQDILMTEAAFYRSLKTFKGGIEAAVPKRPETMIVIESTTNGVGTDFHNLALSAKDGKSPYELLFLPWYMDEQCEYREILRWTERQVDEYFEQAFYEYPTLKDRAEQFLKREDGTIHLPKLAYYYEQLRSYEGDELQCQQEHPCTFSEAFIAGGDCAFFIPLLDRFKLKAKAGKRYDPHDEWTTLDDLKETTDLRPNQDAYLEVWLEPRQDRMYLISADSASGQEGGDFSCAYVFDVVTQQVCAVLHGRIENKPFAKMVQKLGDCYNYAQIVPEVDGPGYQLLDELKGTYFNLYQRRKEEGYTLKPMPDKLGWETTPSTRKKLIFFARTMLKERVQNATSFLPDIHLLDEMCTFVRVGDKFQAAKNCYDDRVMAWMIGLYTCFHVMDCNPDTVSKSELSKPDQKIIIPELKIETPDKFKTVDIFPELDRVLPRVHGEIDGPFRVGDSDDYD